MINHSLRGELLKQRKHLGNY